jgi:iron-sulfur cluster assembly accessory protein
MITFTEKAKEKMSSVLREEKATILRFGLRGGGCSGFQYFFSIETDKSSDDIEFPLEDALVLLVDPMSAMYLEGAEIDYKVDLMGEAFVFNNPNTSSKCGCGSSVNF